MIAMAALAGAAMLGLAAAHWPSLRIAMSVSGGVLALAGSGLLLLALLPAIEIHEGHLTIGQRAIAWGDIRRLDQIPWVAAWNPAASSVPDDGRRELRAGGVRRRAGFVRGPAAAPAALLA